MSEIYVEVRPKGATLGDLAPGAAKRENLLNRLDDISSSLEEVSNRLSAKLETLATQPGAAFQLGEVAIKFSLDLETEAGVIVARAKSHAGFEVSLTWKNPQLK